MSEDYNMGKLAALASQQVIDCLMGHFQQDEKDRSHRRAMFSHARGSNDYGNSLIIDVTLEDGNKKAHMTTKLGKVS